MDTFDFEPPSKKSKDGSETMVDTVFEKEIYLIRNNSKKLYLNSKTADVNFVFGAGTDHVETVAAHKIILSISSPMFDTMFFGSLPEQGDVPIVDTSPAAFKEFLQFFYLNKVRLTSEHIIDVSILCKKYGVTEALKLCEEPLQKSFTIDEMCSGYALAILLEITNTMQFCEREIIKNAEAILKSTSFLKCNCDTFDKIIQLVTSKCSASALVDACMVWAKAECVQQNLKETTANLKAQLGQSFGRIPFAELNKEQFEQFMTDYSDLLDKSDLATIISKMMTKKETEEQSCSSLFASNDDRRVAINRQKEVVKYEICSSFVHNSDSDSF
ncbi:BTB/POZ domain-containing protein 6-A-like [Sitodiplosis mosellana]|uniref:BTB/POZ domain-containing protein 6-A-like n=1 Tax=Sitodiplosis mosellana TaxID=263140 RepID=UPI0024438752|nr:BTB/POZ domain-containing protein 6-A-like [Sitodiplosis mosellana]